jgi:hypothetical protein
MLEAGTWCCKTFAVESFPQKAIRTGTSSQFADRWSELLKFALADESDTLLIKKTRYCLTGGSNENSQ